MPSPDAATLFTPPATFMPQSRAPPPLQRHVLSAGFTTPCRSTEEIKQRYSLFAAAMSADVGAMSFIFNAPFPFAHHRRAERRALRATPPYSAATTRQPRRRFTSVLKRQRTLIR